MGKPLAHAAGRAARSRRAKALARPELRYPNSKPDPESLALAEAARAGFVGRSSRIFVSMIRGEVLCVALPPLSDVIDGKKTPQVYWLEPSGEQLPQDAALTVIRSGFVVASGDGLFERDHETSSQTYRVRSPL